MLHIITLKLMNPNPQMLPNLENSYCLETTPHKVFYCLLHRVPCRGGTCKTPMEVTSSQLIASQLFPTAAVKALLYPGAIANAFLNNKPIPRYNNLPKLYKFTSFNSAPAISDLQRLEVSLFKAFPQELLIWKFSQPT